MSADYHVLRIPCSVLRIPCLVPFNTQHGTRNTFYVLRFTFQLS
jgi:hypothetical protein